MDLDGCNVSLETLADYLDQTLSAAEREQFAAHLNTGCRTCAVRLTELRRLIDVLAGESLTAPPVSIVRRAKSMFRRRLAEAKTAPILARLMLDSRQNSLAMGARSSDGSTVQLLYQTALFDIDLWQEPDPQGGWYLIGQVYPRRHGEPFLVEDAVMEAANGVRSPADACGAEFHFAGADEGTYQITLGVGSGRVVIENVRVGA